MSHKQQVRMFPGVMCCDIKLSESNLALLMDLMRSNTPRSGRLPAGYTYLGQMLSHELNASTDGKPTLANGDLVGASFPSPRLDLSSIYGDREFQAKALHKGMFKLKTPKGKPGIDLLRLQNDNKVVVAETRNDENYIVAQLHVLWLNFHNKVYEQIFSGESHAGSRFEQSKEFVTQTFRKVVIEDFMRQLLHKDIYALYFVEGQRFLLKEHCPAIPVEFSHGGFRFGHSMVRQGYRLRKEQRYEMSFIKLFITDHGKPVPDEFKVDWRWMFSENQTASLIDLDIADAMCEIPGDKISVAKNIIRANLKADSLESLPTPKQIFDWLRLHHPKLSDYAGFGSDKLKHPPFEGEFKALGMSSENMPLWVYTLMENHLGSQGIHLGKLASIIVAEVMACFVTQQYQQDQRFNQLLEEHFNVTEHEPLTMMKVIDFVYAD